MKAPPQTKASTPRPAFRTKDKTCQTTYVSTDNVFFDTAKSAPFFSSANTTLDRCNPSLVTSMVIRNSFNAHSLTLEDEEDNIKSLTAFSSSPHITTPLHVSTKPQHNKNKHQKSKMFFAGPSPMKHLPRNIPPALE